MKSSRLDLVDQLLEIITSTYDEVYAPDSYNVASGEFNYEPVLGYDDLVKAYRRNPLTRLTSPFGLTNEVDKLNDELTLRKIGENFVGWQDNKKWYRQAWNIFKGFVFPITPLLNTIYVLLKTAHSVVAFFTEYLPAVTSKILFASAKYFNKTAKTIINQEIISAGDVAMLIVTGALAALTGMGFAAARVIEFVAKAITSPFESPHLAWHKHTAITDFLQKKFPGSPKTCKAAGYLAGTFLAASSIVITSTALAASLPFLITTTLPSLGIFLLIGLGAVSLTILGTVIKAVADWCRHQWRISDSEEKELVNIVEHDPTNNAELVENPGNPRNPVPFNFNSERPPTPDFFGHSPTLAERAKAYNANEPPRYNGC